MIRQAAAQRPNDDSCRVAMTASASGISSVLSEGLTPTVEESELRYASETLSNRQQPFRVKGATTSQSSRASPRVS